ncbi:DNA-directed RNA polymerase subunit K [Candidatus Woesearchaeota archaeon]|nr:DNA-directed RNA polymerase subunit K [Candidatus Woesearchaeota archaeon]
MAAKAKNSSGEQYVAEINNELKEGEFTRYEKARIIGSRSLQIAQGAPTLIKLSKKQLEELKYNPIEIAKKEFAAGKIPISVKRSLPHEKPNYK